MDPQNNNPSLFGVNRIKKNLRLGKLADSYDKTNLDITNPLPQGGPLSDQPSGFVHKFLPTNTYLNYIKKYR
jgi:hypothetical protein